MAACLTSYLISELNTRKEIPYLRVHHVISSIVLTFVYVKGNSKKIWKEINFLLRRDVTMDYQYLKMDE